MVNFSSCTRTWTISVQLLVHAFLEVLSTLPFGSCIFLTRIFLRILFSISIESKSLIEIFNWLVPVSLMLSSLLCKSLMYISCWINLQVSYLGISPLFVCEIAYHFLMLSLPSFAMRVMPKIIK